VKISIVINWLASIQIAADLFENSKVGAFGRGGKAQLTAVSEHFLTPVSGKSVVS